MNKAIIDATLCIIASLILYCLVILFMTGCTLSFQTIETHGTAKDLVDETQAPSTSVPTNLSLPIN